MKLLEKIKEILSAIWQWMHDIWFVLFSDEEDEEDDASVLQDHCVLSYQSKLRRVIVKNHKSIAKAASQLVDPVEQDPSLSQNFLAKETWQKVDPNAFSGVILRLSEIKTELSKPYSTQYVRFAENIRSHGMGPGMDWLQAPHYKGRLFHLLDKRLSRRAYTKVRKNPTMKHNFFHLFQIVLLLHDAHEDEPFLQHCQWVRLEKFFWAAFMFYRLQDEPQYQVYMLKNALPFLEKYRDAAQQQGYQSEHLGAKEHNVQKRIFPKKCQSLSTDAFVDWCKQACKSPAKPQKKQNASDGVLGSSSFFGDAVGCKTIAAVKVGGV